MWVILSRVEEGKDISRLTCNVGAILVKTLYEGSESITENTNLREGEAKRAILAPWLSTCREIGDIQNSLNWDPPDRNTKLDCALHPWHNPASRDPPQLELELAPAVLGSRIPMNPFSGSKP